MFNWVRRKLFGESRVERERRERRDSLDRAIQERMLNRPTAPEFGEVVDPLWGRIAQVASISESSTQRPEPPARVMQRGFSGNVEATLHHGSVSAMDITDYVQIGINRALAVRPMTSDVVAVRSAATAVGEALALLDIRLTLAGSPLESLNIRLRADPEALGLPEPSEPEEPRELKSPRMRRSLNGAVVTDTRTSDGRVIRTSDVGQEPIIGPQWKRREDTDS